MNSVSRAIPSLAVLSLSISFSWAHAGGDWKYVLKPQKSTGAVRGLFVDEAESRIEDSGDDALTPFEFRLAGRYRRENFGLLVNGRKIDTDADGKFQLIVPLRRADETLAIVEVSPDGSVRSSPYILEIQDWQAMQSDLFRYRRKNTFGYLGVGLTTIAMQGSVGDPLSETALTLRAGAIYRFRRAPLELSGNGYFTPLPLSKAQDTVIRPFGLDAKAGYHVPWLPEPWDLSFLLGFYYATIFSSPDAAGYRDLFGPLFQPVLARVFPNGDTVRFHLKLAPAGDSIQFSNWEGAFGVAYAFASATGRGMSLQLDAAQLSTAVGARAVSMTTFTLGVTSTF